MKQLRKACGAVAAAGLIMLAACGAPGEQDESRPDIPQEASEQEQAQGGQGAAAPVELTPELETLLMERYIIPYEYFAMGYEWDFTDPHHTYDYDENDLDDIQLQLEWITSGFGMSVLVRELPQEARETYIVEQNEFGIGYNLTEGLHRAVADFYFAASPEISGDSHYAADRYVDGLPTNNFQDGERAAVTLGAVEQLDEDTVQVIVHRTIRDGTIPLLSCRYLLRPFVVEEVPAPLETVYSPGDVAFRFLSVADIPMATGERTTVSIRTVEDLEQMARDADSGDAAYLQNYYQLENDLDLTGVHWSPAGQHKKANRHDPGDTGFGAVFDGGGHTIRGLKVHQVVDASQKEHHLGLFAVIGKGGMVRDLHLEDGDILLEEQEGREYAVSAGLLAGTCYGTVTNSSATGTVTGTSEVGGLVGCAGWGSAYEVCTVDAQVTGNNSVGVFAGAVHNARLAACKAKGQVTSVPYPWSQDPPRSIGGFTGSMVMGQMTECWAAAQVKTTVNSDWVGGFIGYHQGALIGCKYDSALTAGWEGLDVIYNDAPSDLEGVPGLAAEMN